MSNRYFLYLITAVILLFLIFLGFISWKFLLGNAQRSREIHPSGLELQDIDLERYNRLEKKGT